MVSHRKKVNLNLSSLSFVIRVNLFHTKLFLFPFGLLISLWCFSILVNLYFLVFFSLKIIFLHGRNN